MVINGLKNYEENENEEEESFDLLILNLNYIDFLDDRIIDKF